MVDRIALWVPAAFAVCMLGCAAGNQSAPDRPDPAPLDENPYRSLESVQSFEQLQVTLDELKEMILEDAETEREASEGMRALLRALSMSSDVTGDANPKAPHFARMDTKIRKVGGDNPDAEYDNIGLDNRWDYVIRGNEFDGALVRACRERGVEVREATPVKELRRERGGVVVETASGPIYTPRVIGADGSGSIVRRRLVGGGRDTIARAAMCDIPIETSAWDGFAATVVAEALVRALQTGHREAVSVGPRPDLYR